jgi:hypothetical protein
MYVQLCIPIFCGQVECVKQLEQLTHLLGVERMCYWIVFFDL